MLHFRFLEKFIHTRTFCLLFIKLVALVADAGVSHRQINTVSCSTDIGVHCAFIDF